MIKPNILLIISDQHRADTQGYKNINPCRTPNLDRLVEKGISFDRAISPCPLCGPARASIFTGLYPHQARGVLLEDNLGVRSNDNLDTSEIRDMMINDSSLREPSLLTGLLKNDDYYTAYSGKWHLGNDIIKDWFDDVSGCSNKEYIKWAAGQGLKEAWPLLDKSVRSPRIPHMSIPVAKENKIHYSKSNDAWITDHVIDFIKKRPQDKPFFIICGLNGPHPPFKIPEPYFSMYDSEEVPEPPNFRPGEKEPRSKTRSFYRTLWNDHGDTWENWKKSVSTYWGFVTLIDDQVGRMMEILEEENIHDSTLIIYCSDHGEMLGQHGLWHKMQPYEETLRVPLIISAPWLEGNSKRDDLASLIDIPSTILDAAGIQAPESYQGKSLLNNDPDTGIRSRSRIFSEQEPLGSFHGETDWRLVTDDKYKYVWNMDDYEELYLLTEDPWELNNLAMDLGKEEIIKDYRDLLISWMIVTN